jgi:hypothetical protein
MIRFTGTRFTVHEKDLAGSMSVNVIIEISDVTDENETMNPTATRRLLMRRFGEILDRMLDGDYGVNVITVEREAK